MWHISWVSKVAGENAAENCKSRCSRTTWATRIGGALDGQPSDSCAEEKSPLSLFPIQTVQRPRATVANRILATVQARTETLLPSSHSTSIIFSLLFYRSLEQPSSLTSESHCFIFQAFLSLLLQKEINPSDWQDTVIGVCWGTLRNEACRPDGHRFIGVLETWGDAIINRDARIPLGATRGCVG